MRADGAVGWPALALLSLAGSRRHQQGGLNTMSLRDLAGRGANRLPMGPVWGVTRTHARTHTIDLTCIVLLHCCSVVSMLSYCVIASMHTCAKPSRTLIHNACNLSLQSVFKTSL